MGKWWPCCGRCGALFTKYCLQISGLLGSVELVFLKRRLHLAEHRENGLTVALVVSGLHIQRFKRAICAGIRRLNVR